MTHVKWRDDDEEKNKLNAAHNAHIQIFWNKKPTEAVCHGLSFCSEQMIRTLLNDSQTKRKMHNRNTRKNKHTDRMKRGKNCIRKANEI